MYFDADVLIVSLVSDDGILKDGTELKDAPFKDEIIKIKKVIVTHIDEMWSKSYGY
ncbi:hypothetical protein AB4E34_14860 [Clostridioides difficile]